MFENKLFVKHPLGESAANRQFDYRRTIKVNSY